MNKKVEIDIQQELLAPSYGQDRDNSVTDFANGTMMNLTIDQVNTYDKNPRRELNSEYKQIKASIYRRGMDQVLSVTRRPSDSANQFMIVHGGNTRLQILKELYEETKDEKFQSLQCRYVLWESESDALIGHLIENDARGDYSFIDRAIGILNTKQELEKELKVDLSSRTLITKLKELGYKLSRADLFRMNYAVNILFPVILFALESNMGPRQIDSLKKLDKYALALFLELQNNNATPEDWAELFKSVLSKQNTPLWSYEEIYTDVLLALANGDSSEANRLSFILSGKLEGLERKETTQSDENNQPNNSANDTEQDNSNPSQASLSPSQQPNTTESGPVDNNTNQGANKSEKSNSEVPPETVTENKPKSSNTDNIISDNSTFIPSTEAFRKAGRSPKNIRSKIFTLALQLASNNGFGDLIAPLPSLGAGFVIKDLPSKNFMKGEELYGEVNKRPYKERIMVWWMLLGFSELRIMSINNPTGIAPLLPEGGLKRALFNSQSNPQDSRRQALSMIFNRTGEFIIDDLTVYFWAVASEKNSAQIQELQHLYRQLNEVLKFNLWEVQS